MPVDPDRMEELSRTNRTAHAAFAAAGFAAVLQIYGTTAGGKALDMSTWMGQGFWLAVL